MERLRRHVAVAMFFCVAAVIAGVVAQLALTDIRHGEADLRMEWRALQVSALFVAAALIYAAKTLRDVRSFLAALR